MSVRGWSKLVGPTCVLLCPFVLAGCESAEKASPLSPGNGQSRRVPAVESARRAQDDTPEDQTAPEAAPAQPVGPTTTQPAPSPQDVHRHIADPAAIGGVLESERDQRLPIAERLYGDRYKDLLDEYKQKIPEILNRTGQITRPKQVQLSLTDAIRRAVQNSYAMQAQSYTPAIEAARIVEAEAQFDAVYFANFTNTKQDTPSPSELMATQIQNRQFESGVRKLLSAGTQVQVSYALTRAESNLVFQTLNPSYDNDFIVEFRQPFLRGFGLDFNRSQIEIHRLDRAISLERLRRDVQEIIYNVDQAYWRLVQARRGVAVVARLIGDLKVLFGTVEARGEHDGMPSEVARIKARVGSWQAEFINSMTNLRNAETALKYLMNDPQINQAQDIEIVPVDVPSSEPVVVDRLGEMTAALTHRPELREARLTIRQAELAVGVAKNQALPRLDAMFRYIVNGLGPNADRAFSQLSENNYHDYIVGVEFEWPIGNRGPEAALRRARLQQAQAIAAQRDTIEKVLLEIQQAVEVLRGNYDQIALRLEATQAQDDTVWTAWKRRKEKAPTSMELEIQTHELLADNRLKLLNALTEYNIALTDLERKKGTLLDYNNIVIRGADDESYLEPYRPIGP